MFFKLIILLVLILLIVSHVLLIRRIPDRKFIKMLEKTNQISSRALAATRIYMEAQKDVDDLLGKFDIKMDALARFVDSHSTNVAFQQEHFSALAKSDVDSARREELRRLKELKVALERLMGVAMTSRQPPSPNDVLALENIESRIEELESLLGSGM